MAKEKKGILVDGKKVQLLTNEDIFDVYGCQSLLIKMLDDDDKEIVKARIYQIQERYITSAKARIRSEAKFVGIDGLDVNSLAHMLEQVREFMGAEIQKASMGGGGPVNLMGIILQSHQRAGGDLKGINLGQYGVKEAPKEEKPPERDVDPEWFKRKGEGAGKCMFDDPKWAKIAKAFLALEDARTPIEICQAISLLNQLQHNSFHVLIDLQTGRMLEDMSVGKVDHNEARKNLEDVLNIARKDGDPMDFIGKMSEEIRNLMNRYSKHQRDPSGKIHG